MGVLMLVHLDRFRAINDLLGFAAGDLVLQVATTRLSELWPTTAACIGWAAMCLPCW